MNLAVSGVIQFWRGGLLDYLGVSWRVTKRISHNEKYASEEEKREAAIEHALRTLPDISWERIAGVLWQLKDKRSLELVKKYIPPQCSGEALVCM